jgi:hypothetical protein
MKQYCYKGDVKKLIPNGWKFQKLFASNYKSYRKNGIYMFVVSRMCLEINELKYTLQPLAIKFILDNIDKPFDFWESKSRLAIFGDSTFPNWALQSGKIITAKAAVTNKVKHLLAWEKDNTIEYLEDGFRIDYNLVSTIKNLTEMGDIILTSTE